LRREEVVLKGEEEETDQAEQMDIAHFQEYPSSNSAQPQSAHIINHDGSNCAIGCEGVGRGTRRFKGSLGA